MLTCIFAMIFYQNQWMHLLADEEMDADGDFKNVKVRKKKQYPPLNSFIPRTFATRDPSQRDSSNFNDFLMNKQQ